LLGRLRTPGLKWPQKKPLSYVFSILYTVSALLKHALRSKALFDEAVPFLKTEFSGSL
jgi:hypothetical protein